MLVNNSDSAILSAQSFVSGTQLMQIYKDISVEYQYWENEDQPPNSAYFDPVTQQWYEINPVFLNVQNFILNWSGDPKFS